MTKVDGVPISVVNYCVQRRWEGQQQVKRWGKLPECSWDLLSARAGRLARRHHRYRFIFSFATLLPLLLSSSPFLLPSFTYSLVLFWDSDLNRSCSWHEISISSSFFLLHLFNLVSALNIFNIVRVACLNNIVENDRFLSMQHFLENLIFILGGCGI